MADRFPPEAPSPQSNMNSNNPIDMYEQPNLALFNAAQLTQNPSNVPILFHTGLLPSQLQVPIAGLPLSFMQQALGLNIPALQQQQQLQFAGAAISNPLLSSFASAASILSQSSSATGAWTPAASLDVASIPAARYCKLLSMDQDEDNLSPYQCLVRQQIELFEATQTDLHDKSQGRNRPIILNQIGIRCKHCGRQPSKDRGKGAIFFPSQLVGLYQTAQNMANKHLLYDCREIPKSVREDLKRVRLKEKGSKTRKSAYGGGRHYWADCLRVLGVEETPDRRLRRAENRGDLG